MLDDPIVAEVREIREKLLSDAGGFDAYVLKLKAKEQEDVARLVTTRPVSSETRAEAART